jgi:hypothetical protein
VSGKGNEIPRFLVGFESELSFGTALKNAFGHAGFLVELGEKTFADFHVRENLSKDLLSFFALSQGENSRFGDRR